jgi:beta-glucosidase
VMMPWLSQVETLIEAWYPGEEGGTALARVLFGDVDPSGRLPVTFPVSAAQAPTMGAPRYPAGPDGYDYTEGRDVGYRGYDHLGLTPLFEFGYGVSYASFDYTGLRITRTPTAVQVSCTVTNTGARAGVAVPQLYLSFPAAVGEPPEQLKGFQRVALGAGESTSVQMVLPRSAFAYWASAGWTVPSGTFRVSVGKSSRRLLLAASVQPPTG